MLSPTLRALSSLDQPHHVPRGDLALEERVVPRVHRAERVRGVADREDVRRCDACRRVFFDRGCLRLGLFIVFVCLCDGRLGFMLGLGLGLGLDPGVGGGRDGSSGNGSNRRMSGSGTVALELPAELIRRDGLCELEGAADEGHALVRAVGVDGGREGAAEERGVGRLARAEQLRSDG